MRPVTRLGWRGAAAAVVTAAVIAGVAALATGGSGGRNGSPTGGVAPVLAKSTGATGLDLRGGVRIVFSCKSTTCAHHESATGRLTAANKTFFAKLFAGWTAYAPLGAGSPCARSTDPGWPCEFEYPNASLNHIGVAYGIVAWSHGAPHASIYRRQTWVRRWHRDTAACFASFMPVHVDGALWSNFPCAAWQLIHQSDGVGLTDGEDAADWPWLNLDPCHTAERVTTCTNKVGDSYRYRAKPTVTRA